MIKTIIYSIKKSNKIRKISSILGHAAKLDDDALFKYLRTEYQNQEEQAWDELIDFCVNDPSILIIMKKHNAGKDTLKQCYEKLINAGAGQWKKGHYVPVSSLVYAMSLDFLLLNIDKDDDDFALNVAYRLLTYFQENEKGKIYY